MNTTAYAMVRFRLSRLGQHDHYYYLDSPSHDFIISPLSSQGEVMVMNRAIKGGQLWAYSTTF